VETIQSLNYTYPNIDGDPNLFQFNKKLDHLEINYNDTTFKRVYIEDTVSLIYNHEIERNVKYLENADTYEHKIMKQ
jgi:hypothetical protein